MVRAAGIPARYVSGITYSENNWGYHAWAEVYLNTWIPVDPTWDEVGWIDAAHIKLGVFMDSSEVKMKTDYKSTESVKIKAEQPTVDVKILSSVPLERKVFLKSETYPKIIGIGDSSVLTVKAQALTKGCVAIPLKIIPRVDDSGNPILNASPRETTANLCPGEEKRYHFILKVSKSLDKRYMYYNLSLIHI